ncbi:MAG: efflux RND transporter periplasmic adaptor subunit [Acidobacteria bacterium]|nr:efflux RND transporter periplasmic adaptor subunit [Acidobacteriota bacterium]
MLRKKWLWAIVVLLVVGAIAAGVYSRRLDRGITVSAESIHQRDLEAIVSASGKIEPEKTVNISAQSMGRVTRLGVKEGDRVKAGQFLLQIDAVTAQAAVRRDEAAVAGARTALEQSRVSLQSARASLDLARQALKRQQELWEGGLTTRETLERAEADVQIRESDLHARDEEIKNRETQLRQQQAGLQSSQHSLSQVRFEAPFDGIVTRRNIEEGENVVVGTMNNAGTVLLTVADLSVIEAEIEVDETDIPFVQLGQKAKVTVDAIPDKTFAGTVTEIGNSPIQATSTASATTATNFKVTVTIDGQIPDVRPGFTCTAEITTATRANVVSAPIQALTVRELLYDAQGNIIHETRPPKKRFQFSFGQQSATAAAPVRTELLPGQKRQETEGVFVIRDGKATFVPVTLGIAGERYLEVTSGLKEGDRVITGPFESVRGLYEDDAVNTATPATGSAAESQTGGVRVRVSG